MAVLTDSSLLPDPSRGRANSTPLRDEEWDTYVRERKLFTPPSGFSEPIPVSERPRSALGVIPIPESVRHAVNERRRRESAYELTGHLLDPATSSENGPAEPSLSYGAHDPPPEPSRLHQRSQSVGHLPVQVLPPQRPQKPEERPAAVRTRTFEELAERNKRKMSDLQRPLTQAEREQAELEAAKSRWEKSQKVERREVERRQAENQKRASIVFKGKSANRQSSRVDGLPPERQSQGLTSTQLATIPGNAGKRSSTAKVLEWHQQQQGELATEVARVSSPPAGGKRQSRHITPERATSRSIPFPQTSTRPERRIRQGELEVIITERRAFPISAAIVGLSISFFVTPLNHGRWILPTRICVRICKDSRLSFAFV